MRIALILAIALAAGCAKKQKPAATPATTESKPAEAPPGGGAPDADAADENDDKGGTKSMGDPCDGGEAKGK